MPERGVVKRQSFQQHLERKHPTDLFVDGGDESSPHPHSSGHASVHELVLNQRLNKSDDKHQSGVHVSAPGGLRRVINKSDQGPEITRMQLNVTQKVDFENVASQSRSVVRKVVVVNRALVQKRTHTYILI